MATYYTETYFSKPFKEITPDDIRTFFQEEQEEGLTLEFKSYQWTGEQKEKPTDKEKGLLKTICAFLNSSGGLLIWGAPIEKKRNDKRKVVQGDPSPIPEKQLKDSFISKLAHRIVPFAAPVLFQPVEFTPGNFIYLIDVPESEVKPHQFENIYYMRLDGQSIPAPHYFIDALFKQLKKPVLEISLETAIRMPYSPMTHDNCRLEIDLQGKIFNLTRGVNERNLFYRIEVDEGYLYEKPNIRSNLVKDLYKDGFRQVLSNGVEAIFSEIILFPMYGPVLESNMQLTITVGGEYSSTLSQTFIFIIKRFFDENKFVKNTSLELIDCRKQ